MAISSESVPCRLYTGPQRHRREYTALGITAQVYPPKMVSFVSPLAKALIQEAFDADHVRLILSFLNELTSVSHISEYARREITQGLIRSKLLYSFL